MKNNEQTKFIEPRTHGDPDFSFIVYKFTIPCDTDKFVPIHCHPEFELWVTLDGVVPLRLEDKPVTMHPGEGVFINSLQLHSVPLNLDKHYSYIAVLFSASFLSAKGNRIYQKYLKPIIDGSLQLPVKLNQDQMDRIIEIQKLYSEKAFGYELKVKEHLLNIMCGLIEQAKEQTTPKPNPSVQYIRKALDYIEQHFAEKITLQDLASAAGINKDYFCRIFSQLANVSPMEYVNDYRIRQSIELLNNTALTVTEICYSCGFHSCSYYNKLFLRSVGISPGEYRRNRKKA